MSPVNDAPLRELARRAVCLLQDLPRGKPVGNMWIREIELGPYRVRMREPMGFIDRKTLVVFEGSNVIYSESYTLPSGPKAALEALKYLRQNMALEDLAGIE